MKVAFVRYGSVMRGLWTNLARQLRDFDCEVYFLDITSDLNASILEREDLGNAIVTLPDCSPAHFRIETRREAQIVDFNTRHRGLSLDTIRSKFYGFEAVFEEYDIDTVVTWNDVELATLVAHRQGIDTVYIENGYIQNTLQVDPDGVNRNASIADLKYDEIVNFSPPSGWNENPSLETPVHDVPGPTTNEYKRAIAKKRDRFDVDPKSAIKFLTNRFGPDSCHSRMNTHGVDDGSELPSKYVFLPFQVHDDTQIIYNSEYIDDMYDLIDIVSTALGSVAPEYELVVKEHPADVGRIDYTQLRRKYLEIPWFQNHSLDEILDRASAVVTVNSSVGFQALEMYKPVVTLGDSFYNSHPYVFHSETPRSVPDCIEAALATELDQTVVDSYIDSFRTNIFIPGSPDSYDEETIWKLIVSLFENSSNQISISSRIADSSS